MVDDDGVNCRIKYNESKYNTNIKTQAALINSLFIQG